MITTETMISTLLRGRSIRLCRLKTENSVDIQCHVYMYMYCLNAMPRGFSAFWVKKQFACKNENISFNVPAVIIDVIVLTEREPPNSGHVGQLYECPPWIKIDRQNLDNLCAYQSSETLLMLFEIIARKTSSSSYVRGNPRKCQRDRLFRGQVLDKRHLL